MQPGDGHTFDIIRDAGPTRLPHHEGSCRPAPRRSDRSAYTFYVVALLILFLGITAFRSVPADIFPEAQTDGTPGNYAFYPGSTQAEASHD